jgi:hypothetical protein
MKELLTRRNIVIGAGSAVVLAAAAFEGSHLLRKRHAPTSYDDLLSRLDNRDADAQIGEAVLANIDDFNVKTVAADARARLQSKTLAQVVSEDAREGRLLEAGGWVIPETLGLLCALAAKAAA